MTTNIVVVKSNQVIEASYQLTATEHHVLHGCIAQIDSEIELQQITEFTLYALDYATIRNITVSAAYKELKNASQKLLKRIVRIRDPVNPESKGDYLATHWIAGIKYVQSKGSITLCFSPYILPYLSQIQNNYTRYELQNVSLMGSIYAIRLYEWLMQWRTTQTLEISLDEYRKRLQVESKYPSIKDLKLYTLKPALKGINEVSDIIVEWNQKKLGRTVSYFVFTWKYKKTQKTIPKKPLTPEEYAKIHPKKTKGKTYAEVISMIKNDYLK